MKIMINGKPRVRYPWDKWLARKTPTQLSRGKDYHGSTRSFIVYARQVARDRGLRITVNVLNHGQAVRFAVVGKSLR